MQKGKENKKKKGKRRTERRKRKQLYEKQSGKRVKRIGKKSVEGRGG